MNHIQITAQAVAEAVAIERKKCADEIERLRAENAAALSANAGLSILAERLRAALKPFAEAAWNDHVSENDAVPVGQKRDTYTLTVGDIRRARAAFNDALAG